MPYKDLQKSREAHKEMMRRKREGVTSGVTNGGCNISGVTFDLVFQDDGSILKWDAVEGNKVKLTKLITYMNGDEKAKKYLKDIRFGVFGCTLDRMGIALGVIE